MRKITRNVTAVVSNCIVYDKPSKQEMSMEVKVVEPPNSEAKIIKAIKGQIPAECVLLEIGETTTKQFYTEMPLEKYLENCTMKEVDLNE